MEVKAVMPHAAMSLGELPTETRLARLEALVAASLQLSRGVGLNEVLRRILQLVAAQLGCERATVFLFDERTGKLHARQMNAADVDDGAAAARMVIVLEPGTGIAGFVAATGESVAVDDVQNDPRFDSSSDRRTGYVTRTMLCVPLRDPEGNLRGAVQAINSIANRFTPADLVYLEAFATLAAVAVEREQLAQANVRSRLLATELELARQIQSRLLPTPGNILPPGVYQAWGFNRPCYDVGGDAYDVTLLPSGECAFWVADVSGKGIGAALLMTTLQTELRSLVNTEPDLARLATELNRRVAHIAPSGTYATLFLGVLSAADERLRYVNAGHLTPLLIGERVTSDAPAQINSRERYSSGGFPIGLMPDAVYEAGEVAFPAGTRLAVYSDGVTDAADTDGETYEEENLARVLAELPADASGERAGEAVLADLDRFRIGAPANDDTTLLIISLD